MERTWHRRAVLAAGAAGVASLAGCSTIGSQSSGGSGITLDSLDVAGSPGGTVSLDPSDKVVLLDFFATWCAPCKPEMANLRAARERFDPGEVALISITQETDRDAIRQFWRRYEGTWPVAIDADLEATRAYDVTGIPTIVIETPDGERVWRHTGLAGEEAIVSNLERALQR